MLRPDCWSSVWPMTSCAKVYDPPSALFLSSWPLLIVLPQPRGLPPSPLIIGHSFLHSVICCAWLLVAPCLLDAVYPVACLDKAVSFYSFIVIAHQIIELFNMIIPVFYRAMWVCRLGKPTMKCLTGDEFRSNLPA